MATRGRELIVAFCETLGLPANRVSRLTLDADAKKGILDARVDMIPELTGDELKTFGESIRQHGSQLIVHVYSDTSA